jgi:hypothetical protein
MKKPNVQLKNIKTFRGMEGYGLNADLYINGIKCIFVIDEGNGGEFLYEENILNKNPKEVADNIQILDDYIASLPPEKYHEMEIKVNRDIFINNLLVEMEEAKAKKKLQKLFNTAIVFGKPNGNQYQYLNFKQPLSKYPSLQIAVKVKEIQKKYCTDGVLILNDNLQQFGITV